MDLPDGDVNSPTNVASRNEAILAAEHKFVQSPAWHIERSSRIVAQRETVGPGNEYQGENNSQSGSLAHGWRLSVSMAFMGVAGNGGRIGPSLSLVSGIYGTDGAEGGEG